MVYYDSSTIKNYLPFTIRSIAMNKNQSKQVTGCSNLVVVLDLHEIALASNSTLKAHNFTPSKLKPLAIYSVFMERCDFFAP